LADALRLEQFIAEHWHCIREPDFEELYRYAGNRVVQDQIRDRDPDRFHCYILRSCPTACDELPEDIGEAGMAGNPCPNNPYASYAVEYEQYHEHMGLLQQAHFLRDQTQLGILPDAGRLSCEDFVVAAIMRRHGRDLDYLMLQRILAQFMSGGAGQEAE